MTYKANIADQRESPAVALARHLLDLGAEVSFHDPYVTEWTAYPDLDPITDLDKAVKATDVTILVQNHHQYAVDDLARLARLFFDTRGATTDPKAEKL